MYSQVSKIDASLIQKVLAGDKNAQCRFVELSERLIYGALHRFDNLGRNEIDDLFQTVYLKLFEDNMRRIRLWRGDSEFTTYLYRIAINTVTDYLGSAYYKRMGITRNRSGSNEEVKPVVSKSPEPDSVVQTLTLLHFISRLRDVEQRIIRFYYFEGFKEREIAEMMDYPLNTVSSIKNRALKKLQTNWENN